MRVFGRSKKLLMGAVVASTLAVAPMAPSMFSSAAAHAATGDQIIFSGNATVTYPAAGLPAVGGTCDPTVGTCYVFKQTACEYRQGTTVAACNITVTNTSYNNIVCGTGTAGGYGTVTDAVTGVVKAKGSFTITFAGGKGVYQTGPDATEQGAGPVSIDPTSPGDPTQGTCVKAFQATGVVTATN